MSELTTDQSSREQELRGLLREWQQAYNRMDDVGVSVADFQSLRRRTHEALSSPTAITAEEAGREGEAKDAAITERQISADTTPDQGDERSKAYDLLYHFLNNNISSCDWQEYSDALDLLYSAQPVAQGAIDLGGTRLTEYDARTIRILLGKHHQMMITLPPNDVDRLKQLLAGAALAQEAIGTFNCPICGNGTPHHHSDFEQVQAMSEEQIDAELRALGIDPDKAAQKVKAVIDHCWAEYDRRLKNPLAAPQPSQGAQPVVDQEPASMSDNGSCGSQVSGKPVSAEAGKGVVNQFRKKHCSDWYDGFPDTEDGGGPYETRTLYVHPSESVAVSGEDWHEPRQLIAGARERANMVATEGSEAWLAEFTRAVLAISAPMPQPEPTSKGAIDWNEERQTDQAVTKPFTEWLARPGQHCQGVGANEAWNAGVAWATSHQREPQEAADDEGRMMEAMRAALVETEAVLSADDVYPELHKMVRAALSAPQEASKLAATEIDLPTDHDVLEHCDQNGTTLAEAAFALAKPSKEAGKAVPVADEAVEWQQRIYYDEPGEDEPGWGEWHKCSKPPEEHLRYSQNHAIGREYRALYLRPMQQALSDDTKRLDWLESKTVNVRQTLRYGSRCIFWAGPSDDDGLPVKSDLREAIDAAILAAAGGGEK